MCAVGCETDKPNVVLLTGLNTVDFEMRRKIISDNHILSFSGFCPWNNRRFEPVIKADRVKPA